MARYVMLEFDDDQMALDFVQAVARNEGMIYSTPNPKVPGEKKFNLLVALVRGFWFKPSKFCDCTLVNDGDFVKGSKYGLFVHKSCKKPRPGHYQHPKNLIDPEYVLGRSPKLFLGSQEPPTSDPVELSGGRKLPMMQIQAVEPTPKDETDRVVKNLGSLA